MRRERHPACARRDRASKQQEACLARFSREGTPRCRERSGAGLPAAAQAEVDLPLDVVDGVLDEVEAPRAERAPAVADVEVDAELRVGAELRLGVVALHPEQL